MEENGTRVPEGWEVNKLGAVCKIKKKCSVQQNRAF